MDMKTMIGKRALQYSCNCLYTVPSSLTRQTRSHGKCYNVSVLQSWPYVSLRFKAATHLTSTFYKWKGEYSIICYLLVKGIPLKSLLCYLLKVIPSGIYLHSHVWRRSCHCCSRYLHLSMDLKLNSFRVRYEGQRYFTFKWRRMQTSERLT